MKAAMSIGGERNSCGVQNCIMSEWDGAVPGTGPYLRFSPGVTSSRRGALP